ncbi:hypothetical protein IWX90DRAFT_411150 [Phyllosticta citrichinensis]|uniref:Uncharacterized protein n=1 Tax=Phyllosticta citrichinensis TaxID=1130410 RepID=A0ABR1Y7N5_9PEZI
MTKRKRKPDTGRAQQREKRPKVGAALILLLVRGCCKNADAESTQWTKRLSVCPLIRPTDMTTYDMDSKDSQEEKGRDGERLVREKGLDSKRPRAGKAENEKAKKDWAESTTK